MTTVRGHLTMKTFTLPPPRMSRRVFLAASVTAPLGVKSPFALTQDQPVDPATLKPGEFSWKPERSPEGPVVILVSIPKQWVVIYRNGVQIAASTCSTGRPGHRTPAGVFVILEKDKNHHSSTLRQRSHALYGAAHVGRCRPACRQPPRLSGKPWLRAAAAGIRQAAVWSDDAWNAGGHGRRRRRGDGFPASRPADIAPSRRDGARGSQDRGGQVGPPRQRDQGDAPGLILRGLHRRSQAHRLHQRQRGFHRTNRH